MRLRLYPRADSNRNRQNRNLKSYPLDYGGMSCKFIYFCGEVIIYVGKSNKCGENRRKSIQKFSIIGYFCKYNH